MLNVLLHDRFTGVLRRKTSGNLQFQYDEAYVVAGGPALSYNMPLRSEGYSHRDCLAFFGNLLPEGDVRAQVALTTGISASNDFRLLERFGGDVAGAVTLLAADREAADPKQGTLQVLSEDELDRLLVNLPERPLAADDDGEIRLSLAGAQNKLPVVSTDDGFALPHGSQRPTTHILKPEPERFQGLVANEFFCMRLAAEVGIPVAAAHKAKTVSGLPYLIVERYDRDLTQEPIRRLHQEDLCQALGKLHAEKYQADGGPTVRDAMKLIDEASAIPARDRPQLWSALVFNVLIGNCDAHGKNYSLLYDSSAPSLAPLYDLVSTAVYEGLTQRLAMSIDGARRLDEMRAAAWDKLAGEVGVAALYARRRLRELVSLASATADALSSAPEHDDPIVLQIVEGLHVRSKALTTP